MPHFCVWRNSLIGMTWLYTHTHSHANLSIHTYIQIYIFRHICSRCSHNSSRCFKYHTQAHRRIHAHTHTHTHTHTLIHKPTHKHARMCAYTHAHTRVCCSMMCCDEQKFWSHRSTSTQPPIILPLQLSHKGFKTFLKPRKVKVTFSATKKSSLHYLSLSHRFAGFVVEGHWVGMGE